jgi:hypothetical protein
MSARRIEVTAGDPLPAVESGQAEPAAGPRGGRGRVRPRPPAHHREALSH